MTDGGHDRSRRATRRGFLAATAGLAAATGAGLARPARALEAAPSEAIEPFYGAHQGGILTPAQAHTLFAAFDLTTAKRADLIELLRRWTDAAALMAAGKPVEIAREGDYAEAPDPADVLGLSAARLTVTFGFGASLFVKDGHGRYGLQARRPVRRSAAFSRRPIDAGANRRRPFGSGLRRQSAGCVPRHPPIVAARL